MASLPGAWRSRFSAGTGRPGVSILWLGEVESSISSFYLSVAVHTNVWAYPSLRYTIACCWDVKQPINPVQTLSCQVSGRVAAKVPIVESMIWFRKRTQIIDSIEYILKQKWKRAGYIARMNDNRWTKRCTEWQLRRRKRWRGRPRSRWQDDIAKTDETTCNRNATDRRQWKALMEGYILQWMNKALVKDERWYDWTKYNWEQCPCLQLDHRGGRSW